MVAIADPLLGIVAYLRADSALASLVGARVFSDELPRTEVSSMPRKCVVVTYSGRVSDGTDAAYVRHGVTRMDIRSYGEVPTEAKHVYWITHRALRALTPRNVLGVRLYNAVPSGGPVALVEDGADWPLQWASYGIRASEIPVPVAVAAPVAASVGVGRLPTV